MLFKVTFVVKNMRNDSDFFLGTMCRLCTFQLNAEYFYPFIGVKKQKVGTRYIYVCEVKSMFEYIANLCETQRDLQNLSINLACLSVCLFVFNKRQNG